MSDSRRHEAWLYGSDDELLEVAIPFLRGGLDAGHPTLMCLPSDAQALVLHALGDDAARITTLDEPDAASPTALLRSRHAAIGALAASGPVRMLGVVPRDPWAGCVWCEAAINAVLDGLDVWIVCPFDTRAMTAEQIADVEHTHPGRATRDLEGLAGATYVGAHAFVEQSDRLPDALEHGTPDLELVDPTRRDAAAQIDALGATTLMDRTDRDGLRLSVAALVANARAHGRAPIVVRAWAAPDRVVATVTDAGAGTEDVLRGVLADGPTDDDSSALFHVREATSALAMFRGAEGGFTVRLTQRATAAA